MPLSPNDYTELLKKFYKLLERISDNALEAGHILARLVESDPRTFATILRESPVPQSRDHLDRLLRLGRKQLHLALYSDNSEKGKIVSRMPYDDQVKFVENGIHIAVEAPDGSARFVKMKYAKATLVNVRTACGRCLKPRAEQIEFLKKLAQSATRLKAKKTVAIENGKLVVRDSTGFICAQFTERQLEKWLKLLREAMMAAK
jgi:hypothetical protein